MSENLPYVNPYKGHEKTLPSKKIGIAIPLTEYNKLKSYRLQDGTVQTTINILLAKLIHECSARGFQPLVDSKQFEHFVANCSLTLRGPDQSSVPTTNVGVDGRRTQGLRGKKKSSPDLNPGF
jgi:hypothetical protein